jgi:predicted AAA+ superfamily ATPase
MERSAIDQLKNWKENPRRKPLIVEGARQVGKTWLIKEFAKQCYQQLLHGRYARGSVGIQPRSQS